MGAIVKDGLKLVIITLVAGLCLGAVYGITKDPIAKQEALAQQKAYQEVFPDAADFQPVEGFTPEAAAEIFANYANTVDGHESDNLKEVVSALDGSGAVLGYIFDIVTPKGYGGDIELTVGIQADGTVNGYSILSISETAGLGMNAKAKPEWAAQYAAKKVEAFTVVKDGTGNLSAPAEDNGNIDAISGATITSKAVTGAMNNCLAYFQSLEGGN